MLLISPVQAVVVSLRFPTAAARLLGIETHVCELQLVPAVLGSRSELGDSVWCKSALSSAHKHKIRPILITQEAVAWQRPFFVAFCLVVPYIPALLYSLISSLPIESSHFMITTLYGMHAR
jgi:hypothetical protein